MSSSSLLFAGGGAGAFEGERAVIGAFSGFTALSAETLVAFEGAGGAVGARESEGGLEGLPPGGELGVSLDGELGVSLDGGELGGRPPDALGVSEGGELELFPANEG